VLKLVSLSDLSRSLSCFFLFWLISSTVGLIHLAPRSDEDVFGKVPVRQGGHAKYENLSIFPVFLRAPLILGALANTGFFPYHSACVYPR